MICANLTTSLIATIHSTTLDVWTTHVGSESAFDGSACHANAIGGSAA